MTSIADLSHEPWRFDFFDTLRRSSASSAGRSSAIPDGPTTAPRAPPAAHRRRGHAPRRICSARAGSLSRISGLEPRRVRATADRPMRILVKFLGLMGPQGAMPLATTEEASAVDARRATTPFRASSISSIIVSCSCSSAPGRMRARSPSTTGPTTTVSSPMSARPSASARRSSRDLDTCSRRRQARIRGPARRRRRKRLAAARRHPRPVRRTRRRSRNSSDRGSSSRPSERTRLGARTLRARRGHDARRQRSSACRTRSASALFVTDMAQYVRFLPNGELCEPLVDLVFFYVGEELDWDIELATAGAQRVAPMRIGSAVQLGWTSWLAPELDRPTACGARRAVQPAERMRRRREQESRNRFRVIEGKTMADISLETVTGKLNRVGYDAFFQALRQAKAPGNRNVELAHWLAQILQRTAPTSISTADHFKLDRARLAHRPRAGDRRVSQERDRDARRLQRASSICSTAAGITRRCLFGETQIRTGHVLVGALKSHELRARLHGHFAGIRARSPSTG